MLMNKTLLASAAILTLSVGGYALTPRTGIVAEEVPPIVAQVDNHEQRIGDLEVKTDKTQTQVNQNSADITKLQESTGTEPASTVSPTVTPVARTESSTATTTETSTQTDATVEPTTTTVTPPQPETNPYTITQVVDTPETYGHYCYYTLYNGKTKGVKTGMEVACYEQGTVLPEWLWPK